MTQISNTDLIINPDGSVYHLGLRPENIAETIIGVGDPDRVAKITKYFDEIDFSINRREFVTQTGRIGGKRISVISTGIGTDNVEIFFTELDALFNIDLSTRLPRQNKKELSVIRVGTSGTLRNEIPVDSHLISDYAIGLDNLMSFYNLEMDSVESLLATAVQEKTGLAFKPYVVRGTTSLRERVGSGMITGCTVTCPGFYAPQGRILRVPIRWPRLLEDLQKVEIKGIMPSNFEMETAGYFAWGRLLGHRVTSVNAILANRIQGTFSGNPEKVMDSLIQKVLERV